MRAWYTVGVLEPVAYTEKKKSFSAQVGGAMVRGAYQGTDTSSSPVFPDHQAYQLPHKPAASGGEQLSAELLHRTRCCHPARRQRETYAGPLQDAHDRYQRPERQRGGAFWCGRSIQTRRGRQWLLWQTPLWGDWTHTEVWSMEVWMFLCIICSLMHLEVALFHILAVMNVVLDSINNCWCVSHD